MPEQRGRGRPKKTVLDHMNSQVADPRYPLADIEPDPNFDDEHRAEWDQLYAATPSGHFFPADREDMVAYCRTVVSIRRETEALAAEVSVFVNTRTNSMKANPRHALIRQFERHRMTLADRLQLVPKARVNGKPEATPDEPKTRAADITDLMPVLHGKVG